MVYIIVPTYGRVKETKKFIESVKCSIACEDFQILIIDDHPEKITYKNIKERDSVKVIVSGKELWWVGSINLGIKVLFEQYILNDDDMIIFANNDVVVDKECFDVIKKEYEKSSEQIIHPRTIDQNNCEVSSGTKIKSLFPYITSHPKRFKEEKIRIDMGTARFLCFSFKTLKKIGYINKDLKQYGGDNDFTLRALKKYQIRTYILRDAFCYLNDSVTGLKSSNIISFKNFIKSFYSIRSSNNIYYRYILFKDIFSPFSSFFITLSLTINSIIKFLILKVKS